MQTTTKWTINGKYMQRYAWILLADRGYVSTEGKITENYLDTLVFVTKQDAIDWAAKNGLGLQPHYGTLMIELSVKSIKSWINKVK